jgi:hypothetical protein
VGRLPTKYNPRDLYKLLRDDAPEAAVGVAAASVALLLSTAASVTSAHEARLVLVGLAAVYGLVGAGGFAMAIYRARSR